MDNQLDQLRQQINNSYNPDEFRDLCQYLNLNPDHLVHFTPAQHIDHLLLYCHYSQRHADLLEALWHTRPNPVAPWPTDSVELTPFLDQLLREWPSPATAPLTPTTHHFIGRQAQLAQLLADLQPGHVVTLTGPGGMGKTTLALEALARLTRGFQQPPPLFPHGLLYHSFYDNPSLDNACESLIKQLKPEATDFSFTTLGHFLSRQQALLFLDGAEEVAKLDHLLGHIGRCGVLLTTRQRSQAPDPQTHQTLTPFAASEGHDLLRQLASAQIDDDNTALDICDLLGGFPLAINLIGHFLYTTSTTATELLPQLQTAPFRALDPYGQERRSQSVTWLLQQSLAQIPENAQPILALMGRLAYAPWPLVALQAILPDYSRPLTHLTNFGLLRRTVGSLQTSHALIHGYAHRRLPEPTDLLDHLTDYYDQFASAQSELGPTGYDRLNPHRPHLLALVAHHRTQQNWPTVLTLTWAFEAYLDIQGHSQDCLALLDHGLIAARADAQRYNEAAFLGNLGNAYSALGQVEQAIEHHQQALIIHREIDYRQGEASALGNLGNAYSALGQVEQAIEHHQQALLIDREIGYRQGEASDLGNLGNAYSALGQVEQAIEHLSRSLLIFEAIKSPTADRVRHWLQQLQEEEE